LEASYSLDYSDYSDDSDYSDYSFLGFFFLGSSFENNKEYKDGLFSISLLSSGVSYYKSYFKSSFKSSFFSSVLLFFYFLLTFFIAASIPFFSLTAAYR